MISFCIPARNEEKNLPQTIKAIQKACAKAKTEFEIIVCNNNSTDETEKVATKLGAKVVPLSEPNISKSRNTAARAAKGDTLIFVDADTVLKDTVVAETLTALEGKRHKVVTQIARHKHYPSIASYGIWFYNIFTILTGMGSGHYIGIRKTDFKKLGMFNEEVFAYEDMLFYKKARKVFGARSIKVITKTGYTSYRKYEDGHNLKKFLLGVIGTILNFKVARNRDNLEYWYGKPQKPTRRYKLNKILFFVLAISLAINAYFPYIIFLQDPLVRNLATLFVFILGTIIVTSNPAELLLIPMFFFIDYLGLETGLPFGNYSYSKDLLSLLGVPLFVPFAWFILIKGAYAGIRSALGTATFVVAFDIVLELFALKNGFWIWENSAATNLFPAPIINYISCFLLTLVACVIIKAVKKGKKTSRFYSGLTLLAVMYYITLSLYATPGGLLGHLLIAVYICVSLVNAIKEV
jgi:glycosyltransferase involved in cell wall biosynthesis